MADDHDPPVRPQDIAIIGLVGRFPGANDVDAFWQNLRAGRSTIARLSVAELEAEGIAQELIDDPRYVRAQPWLEGVDRFDAAFFGYSPREAALIDPQHRLFLECAHEALESAGHGARTDASRIGVFGGVRFNAYLLERLAGASVGLSDDDPWRHLVASDKDYLATRVSYKLDLTGPSVTVQTACSTALVAVALACQSLLTYQCDLALAGASAVQTKREGYLHAPDGILSRDGHVRAFDARATGTVFGSGVGVVVLKRLAEALADGDDVLAVVRGFAVNNDGANKAGFTAPSERGQASVVEEALAMAEVDADSIGLIEAHGTGTPVGDPIEVAALTAVFRRQTRRTAFCALGSVKANVGHLGPAAGLAGLAKAVLALRSGEIPPMADYESPNPALDLADSPFYINTQVVPFPASATPRRVGVTALGFGGSNAHLVLEQAPPRAPTAPARMPQMLVVSARSPAALARATHNLAGHFDHHPGDSLADAAFTLAVGRRAMEYRQVVVVGSQDEAVRALRAASASTPRTPARARRVALVCPGQGTQYANMARGLYETERAFRDELDEILARMRSHLAFDLREQLFPPAGRDDEAGVRLAQTGTTQPVVFAVAYALARTLARWGIEPAAMLGHSVGEYVAATLAGVFTLDHAIALVCARGRLMQAMQPGAMLAVPLDEASVQRLLDESGATGLEVAALNARATTVLAGPIEAVDAFERSLVARGIAARRLRTSHAFHSAAMEPMLATFADVVAATPLSAPHARFVSNVTGTWITPAEATDPDYWVRHARLPVQFARGAAILQADPDCVLVEAGPPGTLAAYARERADDGDAIEHVSLLRHPRDTRSDRAALLDALGTLWTLGVAIDWNAFYAGESRHRVRLPTYPFERTRHWLDASRASDASTARRGWFHVPAWRELACAVDRTARAPEGIVLLLADDGHAIGAALSHELAQRGATVVTVRRGAGFTRCGEHGYEIAPDVAADHVKLLQALHERGQSVAAVVHLWSLDASRPHDGERDGFGTLWRLAQAWARRPETVAATRSRWLVVSHGLHDVTGDESIEPDRSTMLGPCRVVPHELPGVECVSLDVGAAASFPARLAPRLCDELLAPHASPSASVALRGASRWVLGYAPVTLPRDDDAAAPTRLRRGGVYVITGGLGGIGLALADQLATQYAARLVLVTRPSRDDVDHPRSAAVRALQARGVDVLVARADVTDEAAMRSVFADAHARFGAIHGVFHAAGVTDWGTVALKSEASIRAVMAAKVGGVRVLDRILRDEPSIDFVLLTGSVSAITGAVGVIDYAAANAYLDAYARHASGRVAPLVVTVDLDAWQDVGMAAGVAVPEAMRGHYAASLGDTIAVSAGLAAFARILRSDASQVVFSRRDLVGARRAVSVEPTRDETDAKPREPRATVRAGYVAPRDEIERAVVEVWEQALGVRPVGIHDDLFDLGGDSLIATKILTRVSERFGLELPIRSMLSVPTVAALSARVLDAHAARTEPAQLDDLLATIEGLSDDEVAARLRAIEVERDAPVDCAAVPDEEKEPGRRR